MMCHNAVGLASAAFLFVALANANNNEASAPAIVFGPNNCVTLFRSKEGSCTISLNCNGENLDSTEFAFNCIGKRDVLRHSFGNGGFEPDEEFDTGIKCERCEDATPISTMPGTNKQVAPKAISVSRSTPKEHKVISSAKPEVLRLPKTQLELHTKEGPVVPQAKSVPTVSWGETAKTQPRLTTKMVPAAAHSKSSPVLPMGEPAQTHESKSHPLPVNTAQHKATNFRAETRRASAESSESSGWGLPIPNILRTLTGSSLPSDVVKYGPNSCVSTYKNADGQCIMATDCRQQDIANYEFGLVCVDSTGKETRHVFGKGSFDANEEFNTQLKCEQCLGLEKGQAENGSPGPTGLAHDVREMQSDIANLEKMAYNLTVNVKALEDKVLGQPTPSPTALATAPPQAPSQVPPQAPPQAAAAPAAASPAPAAALLEGRSHEHLHHKHRHHRHAHRHHLRAHHRHHHRHDDDDASEEHHAQSHHLGELFEHKVQSLQAPEQQARTKIEEESTEAVQDSGEESASVGPVMDRDGQESSDTYDVQEQTADMLRDSSD